MNTKYQEASILKLSDRQHILLRPSVYLGSVDATSSMEFVTENGRFVKKEVTYVPGIVKIINEVLDNAVDEAVRTNYDYANRIKISIDSTTVTIEDNGRGIPVKKVKGTDHYMPVVAFCEARSGSNFSDENRATIGMNGLGAAITNIYSTYFKVDTADGSNRLILTCKDNLGSQDYKVTKNSSNHTKVTFKPDLSRFSLTKIDKDHIAILRQRISFLSVSYPQIKFYLNGDRVSFGSEKNFLEMFHDSPTVFSGDNWFVGVYPNEEDDFSFFSYVNGLYIKNGGNHIGLISNEIIGRVRDKLSKKFKTIKPGDIRNKLSLVVFFKDFKNMKFASQTKEQLTNSISEVRDYLGLDSSQWDSIGKKVLANSEIVDSIIEMFQIKEEFKKKQELKKLSKTKKKIASDKYYAPIGDKKYLLLTEGDSACGSIMSVLGRKGIGYFALKGKPLNTFDTKIMKLVANKEIQTIVDVLDLDLTDPDTDMEYENVVFASDQDADGIHIRALLLTFFYRFAPRMLKEGRIQILQTPLVVGKKKGKIEEWYFGLESYYESDSDLKWEYKKGLGSWAKAELQEIVEKSGGIDELLTSFAMNKESEAALKSWMDSSESDARKEALYGRQFHISRV